MEQREFLGQYIKVLELRLARVKAFEAYKRAELDLAGVEEWEAYKSAESDYEAAKNEVEIAESDLEGAVARHLGRPELETFDSENSVAELIEVYGGFE
jgi:hypothetical protein